jgi:4-amino-4-deoxy-L-arabinose transferase-like glycosyltransferase
MRTFIAKYRWDIAGLTVVLFIAIVARYVAVPHILPLRYALDTLTYEIASAEINAYGSFHNSIIMPLYPLVLSFLTETTNPGFIVGMVTGITSVILVWALTNCLFEDNKAALLAALMMSLYPMSIVYSVLGLTECLFTTLLLGGFLALYKNKPTLASALLILSILTRPALDLFAPALIFLHALIVRRRGIKRSLSHLAVYGILYALMMSPWWYHNYEKYGQFVRLNLGFGSVLYAGNNPLNKSGGAVAGRDYELGSFEGIEDPIKKERALKEAAIKYIRENPLEFIKLGFVKFGRFWSVLPYTQKVSKNRSAFIATLAILPLIILALITIITKRDKFVVLIPLLGWIIYLTLVHMVTAGSVRYRYPLEPFLIILGAPSMIWIWNRLTNKRNLEGQTKS